MMQRLTRKQFNVLVDGVDSYWDDPGDETVRELKEFG